MRGMKRRRFVTGLLTVPAVMAIEPALVLAQRGGRGGATVEPPPEITYSQAHEVAEPVLRFFGDGCGRPVSRFESEWSLPGTDG